MCEMCFVCAYLLDAFCVEQFYTAVLASSGCLEGNLGYCSVGASSFLERQKAELAAKCSFSFENGSHTEHAR